jgi:hypothetical protein
MAWAAVQDIGSTAALLTEMASRYAISNLDVVLPWTSAGNREIHSLKKERSIWQKAKIGGHISHSVPRGNFPQTVPGVPDKLY